MALTRHDAQFDSIESLGKLGDALDGLSTDGHLYDDEAPASEHERRVRISRTYLWLLGYLKKDKGQGTADDTYREAARRFQMDVGLGPDTRLSDEAWRVLRELAPYDTDTNVRRWIADETGSSVFRRAVHLRLFSYGLISKAPPHKEPTGAALRRYQDKFAQALEHFARLVSLFGLADDPLQPTLNEQLLSLLFAHRGLIAGIQNPGGRGIALYATHPDLPLARTRLKRLRRRFLGNLIAVELWLLGYEVRPGNFNPEGPNGREVGGGVHGALKQFASDRDKANRYKRSVELNAWFFDEAGVLQETPVDDAEIDETQLNEVLTQPKRMTKLSKTYQSLGARIIDGVRRVVSWVFGWIRKVFRAVKQLLRNIARALHQGALVIYKHLRAVMSVVAEGFRYVLRTPVGGSDWQSVYAHKDMDFDMDVFINSSATPERVSGFFQALSLRVRAMEVGGALLCLIFGIIRTIISATNAVLGWLGLVIALVKLANRLKRGVELARESMAIVREFERINAGAA